MKGVTRFSVNKKNTNWLRILTGAIALFVLLFILNIFVSPIRNTFYTISSPIQKMFLIVGNRSTSFFGSLLNGSEISKENENLKTENQKLLSQVAALQSITQGNQAQSAVSTTCQNTGFKLLMAGVVGLDDADILSINKGSSDGILEGMPAISQQGVLFGKIIKVYKNFSQVMLISNKNSVVNVKIQQLDQGLISVDGSVDILSAEIDGVVKGSGGFGAYLDLIPISSEINPGDVLVTSALDKSFPKDLLVAKIVEKEKDDQKPFQQATLSLFSDVKSVDNLFVILNYKQVK